MSDTNRLKKKQGIGFYFFSIVVSLLLSFNITAGGNFASKITNVKQPFHTGHCQVASDTNYHLSNSLISNSPKFFVE